MMSAFLPSSPRTVMSTPAWSSRLLPAQLYDWARDHGTPLWVYDAATIRDRIAALRRFDTIRFAQKANANIHILRLMRAEGVLVDAVSEGEIRRALAAGYGSASDTGGRHPATHHGSDIVFTADVLTPSTLETVVAHDIPVNAGSIDMLHQLGARRPGHRVWLRINPGFGHGHSNKTNTGGENSKHGIWHTDLPEALAVIRATGLQLIGLHMHIGSGVDYHHLQEVCHAMVTLAARVDLPLQAISAGGGLSIPYRDTEPRIDTAHYYQLWHAARQAIEQARGHAIHLEIEPGRYLVAEAGLLMAEVRATKTMGRQHFTLVDAGFNDLMRPSMYGSYHGIRVVPGLHRGNTPISPDLGTTPPHATVVAGPLCESGDVFTQSEGGVVQTRELPAAQVGDLMIFDNAGAYGASMSSNYNSRPLAPELLLETDGQVRLIRRRQTMDELLALETDVG